MRVSVITISDSVSGGTAEDRSGPVVSSRCKELRWQVVSTAVRPDDRPAIEAVLKETADSGKVDVILTTGGTGLGPRDVTPEATVAVCERTIPGFPEYIRAAGMQKNPRSILSRGAAGIRAKTVIINLPGSPNGAVESLDAIAKLLPHAVEVLNGAHHG